MSLFGGFYNGNFKFLKIIHIFPLTFFKIDDSRNITHGSFDSIFFQPFLDMCKEILTVSSQEVASERENTSITIESASSQNASNTEEISKDSSIKTGQDVQGYGAV